MISVERVIEYTDLEKEAPGEIIVHHHSGPLQCELEIELGQSSGIEEPGSIHLPRRKGSFKPFASLNPAKDLAPHLFLASLSLCQGDCLLLMDANQ